MIDALFYVLYYFIFYVAPVLLIISVFLTFFLIPWSVVMVMRKVKGTPQNEKINKIWKILLIMFIPVMGITLLVLFWGRGGMIW